MRKEPLDTSDMKMHLHLRGEVCELEDYIHTKFFIIYPSHRFSYQILVTSPKFT